MSDFHNECLKMIRSIGTKYLPWGIEGGDEWISYKQIDNNDFSVRIVINGDYDAYKMQKDKIVDFFQSRGTSLKSEKDVKSVAFGYYKQLEFVDNSKYELEQERLKANFQPPIGTQINGDIHQLGGSFNTGTANTIDNSNKGDFEDKKWFQKEIVKMILSFISGVGVTLFAQYIMRFLN